MVGRRYSETQINDKSTLGHDGKITLHGVLMRRRAWYASPVVYLLYDQFC